MPTSADRNPRRALITRAESGVGAATAEELARRGLAVTIAVGDAAAGRSCSDRIRAAVPGADVDWIALDLSSLRSIREAAADWTVSGRQWDVLINSAADAIIPSRILTEDGFEWNFGAGYLGTFAWTGLLLPAAKTDARIVTVTDISFSLSKIRFHDLRWDNGYRPKKARSLSRLACYVFARELARRSSGRRRRDFPRGLSSLVAYPGAVAPGERTSLITRFAERTAVQPLSDAAVLIASSALDKELSNGDVVAPGGLGHRRGALAAIPAPHISQEETIALRLWRVSEQLTRVPW